MKINIQIRRFNPESDPAPYEQTYTLEVEPNDRILDVLMDIKRFQDGTLGFRKSCAHGVCGSDAMRINGVDRLACKTLVQDVADVDGAQIRIEPLRFFPVQRDLIVDQTDFFAKYRSVKPYLINDEQVVQKERLQSPAERQVFDDTTNCILCSACFSACPILEHTPIFLGPAVIAQAYRFNADSRDRGFEARVPVLDMPHGVWACQNHFACSRCCPRSIKITKRINQTKKMITRYREAQGTDADDQ
jgi:succinate dehydrogenase / fumarate reductase iron-sulfur subunit